MAPAISPRSAPRSTSSASRQLFDITHANATQDQLAIAGLGGPGDDILNGGPGQDVLDGGTGNNVLIQ